MYIKSPNRENWYMSLEISIYFGEKEEVAIQDSYDKGLLRLLGC